jgi:hypothetical protein
VPAGSKIFVGDCARAVSANRNIHHVALLDRRAEMKPICLNGFVMGLGAA